MDDLALLSKALLGLSGTGGGIVAAIMFYMARQERRERIEAQKQLADMHERFIDLLQDTISSREQLASALEKMASKLGA